MKYFKMVLSALVENRQQQAQSYIRGHAQRQ